MVNEGTHVVADHCNTVYIDGNGYGDIGQNIAQFKPELMDVEDRQEFIQKVDQAHQNGQTERKSDGLGYILANDSNAQLDQVIQEGVEAQRPEDYADGFVYLCQDDYQFHIITAGIDEIAEQSMETRMNGYTPQVTGTSLIENGSGIEVDSYCAGDQKLQALRQHYDVETLSEANIIALGNSDSNDGPMMQEAPISIGRERAHNSAGVYVEDDPEFWTRATLTGIASEILEEGKPREEAVRLAGQNPEALEEVEKGGTPGQHTEDIIEIYEDVKGEVE